ncbi:tRNA adenosine deaminase-associated protein [Saxibacter everestensis]|uniref:tRNA adenosine deaminase-associated protein n=1 Tax=Saxibacter everestensis TaxID=2909229 RepID=A0ABY8QRV9_9MICO|nr:tRNA adenosine deaminase-associated protein [Brevibacteriaceae bacterium ZFBP1038]
MSYFTAVLSDTGDSWRARDVDASDAVSLEDLADLMRTVSVNGHDTVAVIEHEDEWFALVRIIGDDDPRVFVSDVHAAAQSKFAEVLADYLNLKAHDFDADEESDDEERKSSNGSNGDNEDDETQASPVLTLNAPPEWSGDADLLADRGVDATRLCELVVQHPEDPGQVLTDIGDEVGFGELLEALR